MFEFNANLAKEITIALINKGIFVPTTTDRKNSTGANQILAKDTVLVFEEVYRKVVELNEESINKPTSYNSSL